MNKKAVGLIVLSSFIGSIAQILLKIGMNNYTGTNIILAVFTPYVFIGLGSYFLSSITWILALKKIDVSYAYPIGSIGYIIVAILGWAFLNETVNTIRVIGISIIMIGVYMVGKSQ